MFEIHPVKKVSVVIPVYNEQESFEPPRVSWRVFYL